MPGLCACASGPPCAAPSVQPGRARRRTRPGGGGGAYGLFRRSRLAAAPSVRVPVCPAASSPVGSSRAVLAVKSRGPMVLCIRLPPLPKGKKIAPGMIFPRAVPYRVPPHYSGMVNSGAIASSSARVHSVYPSARYSVLSSSLIGAPDRTMLCALVKAMSPPLR